MCVFFLCVSRNERREWRRSWRMYNLNGNPLNRLMDWCAFHAAKKDTRQKLEYAKVFVCVYVIKINPIKTHSCKISNSRSFSVSLTACFNDNQCDEESSSFSSSYNFKCTLYHAVCVSCSGCKISCWLKYIFPFYSHLLLSSSWVTVVCVCVLGCVLVSAFVLRGQGEVVEVFRLP